MGALNPGGGHGDAVVIDRWARIATERLAHAQPQIDAVNVFPVADHDTGKNMLATMRAGLVALSEFHQRGPWTPAAVAAALLQGVLDGARGNSGIILTQFWRAFAQTLADRALDAAGYADALARSVVLVQEAVAEPAEGTAWSVLRASAERAHELVAEGAQELAAVLGPVTQAAVLAVA